MSVCAAFLLPSLRVRPAKPPPPRNRRLSSPQSIRHPARASSPSGTRGSTRERLLSWQSPPAAPASEAQQSVRRCPYYVVSIIDAGSNGPVSWVILELFHQERP